MVVVPGVHQTVDGIVYSRWGWGQIWDLNPMFSRRVKFTPLSDRG